MRWVLDGCINVGLLITPLGVLLLSLGASNKDLRAGCLTTPSTPSPNNDIITYRSAALSQLPRTDEL